MSGDSIEPMGEWDAAHADSYLAAILHYSGGFYTAAMAHGMSAKETANAVAHMERAARSLHKLAEKAIDHARRSAIAPHERGAMIEAVAKALCQHSYPARSLEEALSPNVKLWQRMVPEAEIAVSAMLAATDGSTNG